MQAKTPILRYVPNTADPLFLSVILGREPSLFLPDVQQNEVVIKEEIARSSFLIIGGAGSIGHAVVREIFRRDPALLHVVDSNENGLTELIRDLRSSFGYGTGILKTFVLDATTPLFERFLADAPAYDYILNLSAVKHVRSEKDAYSTMRMVEVNVLATYQLIQQALRKGTKRVFSVSTDKATKPVVNLMGATKRIMELALLAYSDALSVTTARFANVLFSNGSLPEGFLYRLAKAQPLSGPNDVRRYFITKEEAGRLCLLALLLGNNRECFVPKVERLQLLSFEEIAEKLLQQCGFEPYYCTSEDEARTKRAALLAQKKWPCYFSPSNTTGEKEVESFTAPTDHVENSRFYDIAVVQLRKTLEAEHIENWVEQIQMLQRNGWGKYDLIQVIAELLGDEFVYTDTGRYLDEKM